MTRTIIIVSLLLAASRAFCSPPGTSLDGEWLFRKDSAAAGIAGLWFLSTPDSTAWHPVTVPAAWETYPGMRGYDGWGWFSRTFLVEDTTQPLGLYCGGIDDEAIVWVNGSQVGEHSGAAEPFGLELEGRIHYGENRIMVLVKDWGGDGGVLKPMTLVSTKILNDMLKGPCFGKKARNSAPWVTDAVIYSAYLRSASPDGTFAGLERRLPEIKALGATVIWLLPIHPVGVKNRKGTLGSPYAVRDYYGINPEFGTMADFKHLLTAVHRRGMKLIIDLVANHTAWDNPMITEHPEWYSKDSTGAIIPPNPDWTDVADLNYDSQALRSYMMDMMAWWVKTVGIDGFRCDVAELVPLDFWTEARKRLDRIKPVMMLAEGSAPEQHLHAFDLTYSWNLYDPLQSIIRGTLPASTLDVILKNESLKFPLGALRLRFTTNHDKNAWDAPAVIRYGEKGLEVATVLINTMPGVPLIYCGEEVANNRVLSLFEKIPVDWSRPATMGKLQTTLSGFRKAHPAIAHGSFVRVTTDHDRQVFAFIRHSGKDRVLVVLNMQGAPVQATLNIPRAYQGSLARLKEAFERESLAGKGRIRISVEGYGYRVFGLERR